MVIYILKIPLALSTFSSVCTIIGAPCALFVTLPLASKVRAQPKNILRCVIEIHRGILQPKLHTSLCLNDGLRFVINLKICSSKCYYPQNHYHWTYLYNQWLWTFQMTLAVVYTEEKRTVIRLWPVTDIFQLKIHWAEMKSSFVHAR